MRVSTVSALVSRCAAEEPRLGLGPVLGVLFAILYAYFLTRNYYWDGVSLAIDIEKLGRHGRMVDVQESSGGRFLKRKQAIRMPSGNHDSI